jgi:peroxiredoxin Q/BCP
MAIHEGRKAPEFTLTSDAGKSVSLSDYAGKNVVVYFYPEDDTPGCTAEACGLRDSWSDLKRLGAVVLGVSPDDTASHKAFIKKYKLPFTLLSDPDKSMMKTYQAWGKKVMFGKTITGTIRSTVWIGPDGKVKKHWRRVPSAAAHADDILKALKQG